MNYSMRPKCIKCETLSQGTILEGSRVLHTDDWDVVLLDLRKRFELGSIVAGILVAGENQRHVTNLEEVDPYVLQSKTAKLYAQAAESLTSSVTLPHVWDGRFDVVIPQGPQPNRLSNHYYELIIPIL